MCIRDSRKPTGPQEAYRKNIKKFLSVRDTALTETRVEGRFVLTRLIPYVKCTNCRLINPKYGNISRNSLNLSIPFYTTNMKI